MLLTFEEYKAKGGNLDVTAFTPKIKKSEYLLNYWTMNRITADNPYIEQVKDLLFEMVNNLGDGQEVTSFSNDGVSVSFSDVTEEQTLYDLAVAYLPVELVSTYVGGNNEN